jgi:prepilin-type N-terminal cleavage/methylation domain-containing protein
MRSSTDVLRCRSGFSLIELVVAVTVLTIAGTGLFLLASSTTTGTIRSQDEATAMGLAVDKIEQLKNSSFDSMLSGGPEMITSGGASGGIYSRSWVVTWPSKTVAGVSAKDVTVSVSWTGGGTLSLATMVVNPKLLALGFPTVSVQSWNQLQ